MEDLLWKKESTKRFRYLMLFFIRLAEVLTASIIPSIIGIMMVFITPKVRVMQLMETISFIAFVLVNCIFWIKYVRHRPKRGEFYVLNGIVYALYVGLSFLAYEFSDVYLYTILFSNLRGFEIFGFGTFASLYNTHIILILTMIISETAAHFYYKHKAKIVAENGAEEVEIKEEDAMPEQDNKEVKFLTVDEVNLELEHEMAEAAELIRAEIEDVSDKNWDEDMVQGDYGEIIEATPYDPDNDIDDDDYVSEAYAREEMSVTQNYDVDSLWNEEIYKNREVASDYDDEVFDPEMFISEDDDSLWDSDMYRGRDASSRIGIAPEDEYHDWDMSDNDDEELFYIEYDDEPDEYMSNSFEDYDSDSLWGDFTQGK